jgi:hypothetical protein
MTTTTDSFQPAYGGGVTVTPTSSSASSTLGEGSFGVVVTNLSTTTVSYVRIGRGAQTATIADYPVLPATQVSLSKSKTDNTVAYIASAPGASLHIIAGRGL